MTEAGIRSRTGVVRRSVAARGGNGFLLTGEKAGVGIRNRSGRNSLDDEQAGAEA